MRKEAEEEAKKIKSDVSLAFFSAPHSFSLTRVVIKSSCLSSGLVVDFFNLFEVHGQARGLVNDSQNHLKLNSITSIAIGKELLKARILNNCMFKMVCSNNAEPQKTRCPSRLQSQNKEY